MVENRIGLFALLLRLGLHDLAQPKAHPIQDLGHRTGRGPLVRALPLVLQRLEGRWGRQPRGGQARAKRWVWLRMGVGTLTKRLGCLRRLLFPAFATTASRLRAQTDAPGSSLCQAQRHGLAPPT